MEAYLSWWWYRYWLQHQGLEEQPALLARLATSIQSVAVQPDYQSDLPAIVGWPLELLGSFESYYSLFKLGSRFPAAPKSIIATAYFAAAVADG